MESASTAEITAFGFHVGEQGDFTAIAIGNRLFGAAHQDVGLDTDGAQFFHRMLRRLWFDFPRRERI